MLDMSKIDNLIRWERHPPISEEALEAARTRAEAENARQEETEGFDVNMEDPPSEGASGSDEQGTGGSSTDMEDKLLVKDASGFFSYREDVDMGSGPPTR